MMSIPNRSSDAGPEETPVDWYDLIDAAEDDLSRAKVCYSDNQRAQEKRRRELIEGAIEKAKQALEMIP